MRGRARDETTTNELVAEEGMVLSYAGRPLEALAVLGGLTDDVHPRAWVIAAIAAQPALIATGQFSRAIAVGDGAFEDHSRLSEHIAMARPHVHQSFKVEALAYLGRLDESSSARARCYASVPRDCAGERRAVVRGQARTQRHAAGTARNGAAVAGRGRGPVRTTRRRAETGRPVAARNRFGLDGRCRSGNGRD